MVLKKVPPGEKGKGESVGGQAWEVVHQGKPQIIEVTSDQYVGSGCAVKLTSRHTCMYKR